MSAFVLKMLSVAIGHTVANIIFLVLLVALVKTGALRLPYLRH